MASSASRRGPGPRISVPAPRSRPGFGVTGPSPVWSPPSEGGGAAAPPTVLGRKTVTAGADQGDIVSTFNNDGVLVGSTDIVTYVYNGVPYLYNGGAGSPAVAAAATDFAGGGAGGALNRRLLVAVSGAATPEAAFTADAPVVGGYDQLVYRHAGVDYLYSGDGTLPATAADFVGMSSASTAPNTITFPGGHGLPVPLTAVTPVYIDNAGNLQLARAAAGLVPEFLAISTPDANTVEVAAGKIVELPADIAVLGATGVTQYLSDATPGALTTVEPGISIPLFSYTGNGRTVVTFDWRPLDTSGSTPTSGAYTVKATTESPDTNAVNVYPAGATIGAAPAPTAAGDWYDVLVDGAPSRFYSLDGATWVQVQTSGAQITSYANVADLPDPTTLPSGTVASVLEDSTITDRGLYLVLGTVGANGIAWEAQ